MYLIFVCWSLVCVTHGITGGPYISLLLSHIPKDTKIITFGLMHLLMKIIGYAPGPLIAGVLIGGFQIRNTHCSHGWSAFLGHALLRSF